MTDGAQRRTPAFKIFLGILVAAFFLAYPMMMDAEEVQELTDNLIRQLTPGEILVTVNQAEGPARGTVEAVILIEAPAEPIWQIMNDCDEIPTFVPGVVTCEILDSGENWENIRHEVKYIWFFPTLTYVFRADYVPKREINFIRIQGDLRDMRGSWRLIPMAANNTIVRYRVYLDPGFLVPQWLVRSSLKSDLPAVLSALREKVLAVQKNQGK